MITRPYIHLLLGGLLNYGPCAADTPLPGRRAVDVTKFWMRVS
jgi:hypothetical protein